MSWAAAPSADEVSQALRGYEYRRVATAAGLREASVLVPLVARPGGVELLFIMRPSHMPTHAGQPAFPGGAVDPGDPDRWHTAMREANEELGIAPEAVTRVGRLDDLPTVTNFHVTPHVAWLDPSAQLTPDPGEVAEVFSVPLAGLLDPARRRTMIGRWRRGRQRMFFYLTEPHVVWGATARMVANLLAVLAPAQSRSSSG